MHIASESISRKLACPAILICLALSGTATASKSVEKTPNTPSELSAKKENLDDLRERLEKLTKELTAGESARSEAADQLRGFEKAISDLQRELHDLASAKEAHLQHQRALGNQAAQAESQLGQQRGHLDRLLIQQYMSGSPSPLNLLLSGQPPNQTARDITYLGLIAQARQGVLKETVSMLDEQKRLAEETRRQVEAIAAIEALQLKQRQEMLAQRQQHQKTLSGISNRLNAQRREIETLKRDERRLAQLIDRITKLLAQTPKTPKPKRLTVPPEREVSSAEKSLKDRNTASLAPDFASLRGRLPTPTAGKISQKFGAPLEGGGRGKGVFIRSTAGNEVRAIAGGQVVFADWLRGFGNMIVVDHADGFLSVYGYNDAVLKQVGDQVAGGERIATVGNSGGRSETGLYFELRRQGEAIDPGRWLRR